MKRIEDGDQIIKLAARYRLPAVYPDRLFVVEPSILLPSRPAAPRGRASARPISS
jgi:hypothetical protein